jgi:hypothetical protein
VERTLAAAPCARGERRLESAPFHGFWRSRGTPEFNRCYRRASSARWATPSNRKTTIPTLGPFFGDQAAEVADLQEFMARGGVEPPTPRFSVKEQEAKIWPWLQGLS